MFANRAKHRMLAIVSKVRRFVGYHRLPPLRVPIKFIKEFRLTSGRRPPRR
jgi:hypothetical protein